MDNMIDQKMALIKDGEGEYDHNIQNLIPAISQNSFLWYIWDPILMLVYLYNFYEITFM